MQYIKVVHFLKYLFLIRNEYNNSRKGDRHKKDAEGNRINKASLNLTKKGTIVYSTYINSLSPTSKQIFVDNKRKTNRERYRTKN